MITVRKFIADKDHAKSFCFKSSKEECALYFNTRLSIDIRRHLCVGYLVFEKENNFIGFFTLSAASVVNNNKDFYHTKGTYKRAPAILLGHFAIDERYQRKGYGKATLSHIFKLYAELSEKLGTICLAIEPYEESRTWYEQFPVLNAYIDSESTYFIGYTKPLRLFVTKSTSITTNFNKGDLPSSS